MFSGTRLFTNRSKTRVISLLTARIAPRDTPRDTVQNNFGNYSYNSNDNFGSHILFSITGVLVVALAKERDNIQNTVTQDTDYKDTVTQDTDFKDTVTQDTDFKDTVTQSELDALDGLYTSEQFEELASECDKYVGIQNANILWRRARAKWEIIKKTNNKTVKSVGEAHDLINQALEVDETSSDAHRWKGILSNAYTEQIGLKAQLLNLETMKYHLERAIELDPGDSTAMTLLGIWYFELCEMSWYQIKFAKTFLGDVPPASYDEALANFLRAEEIGPGKWHRNVYLIGLVYDRLGNKDRAKHFLELVLSLKSVTQDDIVIHELADALYRKYK